MATISDITETTVGSTIYDHKAGGMVPGRTYTRRHYTISSCGQDFEVMSVYAEGEHDLVVTAGRAWRVGSDETPTIDDAVSEALANAAHFGLTVTISEEMTHEHHMAQIDRTHAAIDAEIARTQVWDD